MSKRQKAGKPPALARSASSPTARANMTPAGTPARFDIKEAIEDLCARRGFSPADVLVDIVEQADAVAEASGVTPMDAARLKLEASKLILNKVYANKQESKTELTGKDGGALDIVTRIERVIVRP